MADKKPGRIETIGKWSEEKLELLHKYLDEERYMKGSPVRALQCEPSFDRYWFIERSPQCASYLQELRSVEVWSISVETRVRQQSALG